VEVQFWCHTTWHLYLKLYTKTRLCQVHKNRSLKRFLCLWRRRVRRHPTKI